MPYIKVSTKHLREDMKEARRMVRELQRGIKRDERELNMAKRKRGFAGTAAAHRTAALAASTQVQKYADAAAQSADSAFCDSALSHLNRAWRAAGELEAHTDGKKGVSGALRTATEVFVFSCLKTRR